MPNDFAAHHGRPRRHIPYDHAQGGHSNLALVCSRKRIQANPIRPPPKTTGAMIRRNHKQGAPLLLPSLAVQSKYRKSGQLAQLIATKSARC